MGRCVLFNFKPRTPYFQNTKSFCKKKKQVYLFLFTNKTIFSLSNYFYQFRKYLDWLQEMYPPPFYTKLIFIPKTIQDKKQKRKVV